MMIVCHIFCIFAPSNIYQLGRQLTEMRRKDTTNFVVLQLSSFGIKKITCFYILFNLFYNKSNLWKSKISPHRTFGAYLMA